MPLLEVKNLTVSFRARAGKLPAVSNLSFAVESGKTLALVGESGSGKSVTATSILRLLDEKAERESGSIFFYENGEKIDLTRLSEKELLGVRGNKISMIFQEPMTALNPVFSIGKQLSEPFLIHRGYTKAQALAGAEKMLSQVGIPNPARTLKSYPHELSGGMRQRVMIAMALACQPKLLIADEPTTALDVTIQAQILGLISRLQQENGAAILFITHDLAVVGEIADDVAVMYCGEIVECVPAPVIFQKGGYSHPYTEGLLACVPSGKRKGERLESITGSVPLPSELPTACRFAPRCKYATEKCRREKPNLTEVEIGHAVRCFYPNKERRTQEWTNGCCYPSAD